MDNLRFCDFLVVGRHILWVGLCVLAITAREPRAEGRQETGETRQVAQQTEESQPAATASLQKIQRLLKLLSTRYPERYGSVDPGRLDGVLGEETKTAIRKFRSIAGLPNGTHNDERLTAEILSELASMSANSSDTATESAGVDCASTPNAAACRRATAAKAEVAAPAPIEQKPQSPAANEAPTVPQTAAPEAPAIHPVTEIAKAPAEAPSSPAAAPAASVKSYFVQVASLRSESAAAHEWRRIKNANADALARARVYFERAEIEDRGIYYRILIGPQRDRDDAKTLCGTLKGNGQSCVVIVRNAEDIRNVTEHRTAAAASGRPATATGTPKAATASSATASSATAPAANAPAAIAPTANALAPPAAESAVTLSSQQAMPRVPATPAAPQAAADAASKQPAAAAETSGSPLPRAAATASPAAEANRAPSASPASPAAENASPPQPVGREKPAASVVAAAPATAPAVTQEQQAPAAAPPPEKRAETAAVASGSEDDRSRSGDRQSNSGLTGLLVDMRDSLGGGLLDMRIAAALSILLIIAATLYNRRHRLWPGAGGKAVAAGFPISGIDDGASETGQTIASLEVDFESQQLRDSRRVRDEFLRGILDDNADIPFVQENGDSAMRVNGSLKELLVTNPALYKAIFLNLIFLSKLGAALNRKEIAPEQLNDQFSRELGLLQSYFKIHLLELDDRHRIRKELPGLFYCLQLSQMQNRPQNIRFPQLSQASH